jgi:DNA ligase-1
MNHPTLFKRTSTGATQRWHIEQNESQYRVHTGQIDGKITISEWKQAVGKNQGKANETTDTTQASAEIVAQYKKKKAQGRYHESVDTIDVEAYHVPMTAKKYADRWKDDMFVIDETFYSQPKLDGVRCNIKADGMWTRKGKPILAMPHIWEAVSPIFDTHPDIILDGELYNHDLREYLNRISGLVRKQKPTPEELEKTSVIQFHMYDVTGEAEFDQHPIYLDAKSTWHNRMQNLFQTSQVIGLHTEVNVYGNKPDALVHLVDTKRFETQEQLDALNSVYLAAGYEGQMIRFNSGLYEHKYSAGLLKRKEFQDEEFTIISITEGVGNRAGMAGSVEYVTTKGIEFSSGIAGGVDFYKDMWHNKDKFIGGEGTVRFFNWTEYGRPYLPVTHNVYEGKREI